MSTWTHHFLLLPSLLLLLSLILVCLFIHCYEHCSLSTHKYSSCVATIREIDTARQLARPFFHAQQHTRMCCISHSNSLFPFIFSFHLFSFPESPPLGSDMMIEKLFSISRAHKLWSLICKVITLLYCGSGHKHFEIAIVHSTGYREPLGSGHSSIFRIDVIFKCFVWLNPLTDQKLLHFGTENEKHKLAGIVFQSVFVGYCKTNRIKPTQNWTVFGFEWNRVK